MHAHVTPQCYILPLERQADQYCGDASWLFVSAVQHAPEVYRLYTSGPLSGVSFDIMRLLCKPPGVLHLLDSAALQVAICKEYCENSMITVSPVCLPAALCNCGPVQGKGRRRRVVDKRRLLTFADA